MNGRNKRQHYVPQGYLRRFQSDTSNSSVAKIWVIDRFKDVPFNVPIQTVASRDGFYDSKIDDGIEQFEKHGVDSLLQQEEDKFYSALKKLDTAIESDEAVPDDVKAGISWYLYLQFIRTAKFRADITIPEAEDRPDYSKLVQIFGLANRKAAIKFINVCVSSNWVIYRMIGRMNMFTSDNPVVFTFENFETIMPEVLRGDDLTFTPYKGMRIMFPVDPKHVLFLYDRRSSSEKLHLENKVVDFDTSESYSLWTSLINNCDRQIYSSSNDDMCQVIKMLMELDANLTPVRDSLERAIKYVQTANSPISNTRFNSYQGFLARQQVAPIFRAVERLGSSKE